MLDNITGALELIVVCIDEIENKTFPNPLSKGELVLPPAKGGFGGASF